MDACSRASGYVKWKVEARVAELSDLEESSLAARNGREGPRLRMRRKGRRLCRARRCFDEYVQKTRALARRSLDDVQISNFPA